MIINQESDDKLIYTIWISKIKRIFWFEGNIGLVSKLECCSSCKQLKKFNIELFYLYWI